MISFIDILYALAIGTGFSHFPLNLGENIFGTVIFIGTLLIAAQDWYEYHDNFDLVPKDKHKRYIILQIFVLLSLNQMFVNASKDTLIPWLIFGGIFCALNVIWNIITPFKKHSLYAWTSAFLALVAFLLAGFYHTILNIIPFADGRWGILTFLILVIAAVCILEQKLDK